MKKIFLFIALFFFCVTAANALVFQDGEDTTVNKNATYFWIDVDDTVTRDSEWNTLPKIEATVGLDILDSSESITKLGNVSTETATDLDIYVYNATAGMWEPITFADGTDTTVARGTDSLQINIDSAITRDIEWDSLAKIETATGADIVNATEGSATYLDETSNLSDLGNATTARTNLGLGSSAVLDTATVTDGETGVPTGNNVYDFTETTQDYLLTSENNDSADDVTDDNVESMTTAGGSGTAPVSDGAGNLSMTDIATQAELDASGGTDDQNASEVATDTTDFNGVLDGTHTDVQAALDQLDDNSGGIDSLSGHNSTELDDIATTAPSDGDLRQYSTTSSTWEPISSLDSIDLVLGDDASTTSGDVGFNSTLGSLEVGDGAQILFYYPEIDEDDMVSDSALHVPTQQSVKAYVDANAGGGSGASLTVTTGSQSNQTIPVTVQSSVSDVFRTKTWLSDTSQGAPTTTAPDGNGTASNAFTVATGTLFEEHTQGTHLDALTNSTGTAVLDIKDDDEDNTWYLNAEMNGQVYASDKIAFNYGPEYSFYLTFEGSSDGTTYTLGGDDYSASGVTSGSLENTATIDSCPVDFTAASGDCLRISGLYGRLVFSVSDADIDLTSGRATFDVFLSDTDSSGPFLDFGNSEDYIFFQSYADNQGRMKGSIGAASFEKNEDIEGAFSVDTSYSLTSKWRATGSPNTSFTGGPMSLSDETDWSVGDPVSILGIGNNVPTPSNEARNGVYYIDNIKIYDSYE